jgi:hypothetical protein
MSHLVALVRFPLKECGDDYTSFLVIPSCMRAVTLHFRLHFVSADRSACRHAFRMDLISAIERYPLIPIGNINRDGNDSTSIYIYNCNN